MTSSVQQCGLRQDAQLHASFPWVEATASDRPNHTSPPGNFVMSTAGILDCTWQWVWWSPIVPAMRFDGFLCGGIWIPEHTPS